jgi:uroporphyrin-III C-methyltransferase/precorrin-2 dehydrogenase/sirohydrochlorin ferrochelatase
LAFVALDDERAARAATQRLKGKGLLVNVADRPDLCDFIVPSLLDRDPVLVAVGTGGASAGLAKQLRLRLERILPQGLGQLARALFDAREDLRARLPDPADRRRAIDEALREGGLLDPLDEASAQRVGDWATDVASKSVARTETIVLASTDPDDLTIRQARILGEADTLILDGEIPEAVLARARADAVRRGPNDAAQRPGLTLRLVAPNHAA